MSRWLYQATAEPPPAIVAPTAEPDETLVWAPMLSRPMPRRKRGPLGPFECREPLFFGETRMSIDWAPPLERALTRRPGRTYTREIFQNLATDEATAEYLDKWDSQPMRLMPQWPPEPIARFPFQVQPEEPTEEHITVDKWDSQPGKLPVFPLDDPIARFPFQVQPEEPSHENITLDKWWTPFSVPFRLKHRLRLQGSVLDPYPIPDEDLLPKRIPWHVPLSEPLPRPRLTINTLQEWINLITDETVFIESYYPGLTKEMPWRPEMPVSLMPFIVEPPSSEPENITVDKWWTPLPYNFRRRPDAPLPPLNSMPESMDAETITIDKWFSMTSQPVITWFARRAVTGPEGQSKHLTVITAPWIRFSTMDPFPIPDIPGVTYSYWFVPLDIPTKLFTWRYRDPEEYLTLFDPLQIFPIESGQPECERVRRKPSMRTGSCGV